MNPDHLKAGTHLKYIKRTITFILTQIFGINIGVTIQCQKFEIII